MKTKILTALLSFVIAFGLWLYVVTVVSPDSEKTYYNVPVGLQSESLLEERGLMITTTDIPTVNLRLAGNRTDLDKLNSSNITVVADVSNIYEAGEHKLSYNVSYPGDVPNNAISVQKRTPDTVTLVVEERITKAVKVEVEYTGTQAEGFNVDKENIELDNEEFQITGPKRILDQIVAARVTVNLQDRKETLTNMELPYVLVDARGEQVDNALIEDKLETTGIINLQKLRIMRVKEIKLVVQIINGGGATDKTSDITVSPEIITVSGSENLLKELGDELVLGTIELGQMESEETLEFTINLPDGITCESGETEAKVDVSFPNLRTKTLSITNITPANVPKDMEAEIITKVLDIRFRGPKALIDALETEDVTVLVDFKNAQVGTETKQVTITLSDEYAEVGAVKSYTVSATLRQKGK